MPRLFVVDRTGHESRIAADDGLSVMEAVRENGFDELLALCGGCCSCATCHVFVDDEWLAATGNMSEDVNDLLDSSDHRTVRSRLSCHIVMRSTLDGLRVTIAPED